MDLSVSSSRPTRALQGDSSFTKNDAARQTTAPRKKKAPRIAPGLRKPIIRFQVTRAMNHARRLARPHTRAAVRALTGSSAAARARSNASSSRAASVVGYAALRFSSTSARNLSVMRPNSRSVARNSSTSARVSALTSLAKYNGNKS